MIECYVDDLVVKSKKRLDHLQELRQIFERLQKHQMKMNPLNCAFDVMLGKFLDFVVRHRGIEIDQAKVRAIQDMPPPKNLKELWDLQGRLAYIRRFLSNLVSHCHLLATSWRKKHISSGMTHAKKLSIASKCTCPVHHCRGSSSWFTLWHNNVHVEHYVPRKTLKVEKK